jgi:hypothetical protein
VKLWVDDLRDPPKGWWWAQTSAAAIDALWMNHPDTIGGRFEEISLDHDLGGDDTTRPVVLWMIENNVWPAKIRVHTANPVGREWLEGMIARYRP